ncbi:hypothetical protein P261_00563 [Lachnospiraceae bacterium TWA4]|nr:hypothetical protein P261_00563 [Lachnospiraceae bacterium TWA4]
MEEAAKSAIKQIENNRYEQFFTPMKLKTIVCYGIAFYKKQCCVIVKELS